ncbi:MAG TPA: hypothetical protein VL361_28230 [Candidatus Limnocylindrales bacterium]|nr:hypothetical protein [Candidatus Limnocylindrales bacterium]
MNPSPAGSSTTQMKPVLETLDLPNSRAQTAVPGRAEAVERYVPLLVVILVLMVVLLSALKIVSYGFIPVDDGLRHVAKAVSGKPWDQIMVMRPGFEIDHNYGWHQILALLHRAFGWGPDVLLTFAITGLLATFCLAPLPWLRRPEAWLIVLFGLSLTHSLERMALGRPFILTAAILLVLLMLWNDQKAAGVGLLSTTTLMIAAAVWIHGSWYLFALPVIAFALAGHRRSALELTGCWLGGTFLGASLTGHPVGFTVQAVRIMFSCFDPHALQRMLALEFQPSDGALPIVGAVILMLLFRRTRGLACTPLVRNPIFVLAGLGWLLGLGTRRFWDDWGVPAAGLWLALEIQEYLELECTRTSLVRLATAVIVAGGLYLSFTKDTGGRWTYNLTDEYLTEDNPQLAAWLPEKGGILYSANQRTFFKTFFKNPKAEWRYMLGFEPTFMPPEDLKIIRDIQWTDGALRSYLPWVKKMRPEDRLVINGGDWSRPDIKELEWHYAIRDVWIGRLPKAAPAKP